MMQSVAHKGAGIPNRDAAQRYEMSTKKTGWEALDKWVGPDGAATEPGATGSSAPSGSGASSGGGFMGWLKRLFGGK